MSNVLRLSLPFTVWPVRAIGPTAWTRVRR